MSQWLDVAALLGALAFSVSAQLRTARKLKNAFAKAWRYAAASTVMIGFAALDGSFHAWPSQVHSIARGLGMLLALLALLSAPSTQRSLSQWRAVFADGWIVTASYFCVLWMGVNAVLGPMQWGELTRPFNFTWVALDLCATSALVGLLVRANQSNPQGRALPVVYGFLAITADVLLLRGVPLRSGVILIVALALITLGVASLVCPLLWLGANQDPYRPLAARRTYYVAVPGFLAASFQSAEDPLLLVAFVSLLVIVVSRLLEVDRENRRLWLSLETRANRDSVTGLFNRGAFLAALRRFVKREPCTVFFIDLDHFKNVNDLQGHAAGDAVLRRIAHHLRAEEYTQVTLSRLGGDEFAVLIPSRSHLEEQQLAEMILQRLDEDPQCHGVSASIGIGRTDTAATAEEVLKNADLAMYFAKARGGDGIAAFAPWMRTRTQERTRIVAALEEAVERRWVFEQPLGPVAPAQALLGATAAVQLPEVDPFANYLDFDLLPVVDLATDQVCLYEALLRWNDRGHRALPEHFLPAAQSAGLSAQLSLWVMEGALRWLADQPHPHLGASFNADPDQLRDPHFPEQVCAALEKHGIAPERLTIEVTERSTMESLIDAKDVLMPLRAAGVHVALDDFGAGTSSLRYLADLPVDVLKIDHSFVAGIGERDTDDAVIRAVLRLAKDLGLLVIAEGIQTQQQLSLLREWGCPKGQGFYFSQPVRPGELKAQGTPIQARVPADSIR